LRCVKPRDAVAPNNRAMSTATPPAVQQLLAERAQQLEDEIAAKRRTAAGALDGHDVSDTKDGAQAESAGELADAEIERDLGELREIAAARRRIAEGRYGRCIDCDAGIDDARLLAQPTAVRCLACQAAGERAARH
jgi:DnaK suppressor protein